MKKLFLLIVFIFLFTNIGYCEISDDWAERDRKELSRREEWLKTVFFRNEKQYSIFTELVKEKYRDFLSKLEIQNKKIDYEYNARFSYFWVRHYADSACIIMIRDEDDTIWCMIKDSRDNKKYYFTNDREKYKVPHSFLKAFDMLSWEDKIIRQE